MKVLQINCTYREGSTGKITYDIHSGLLRDGFASEVCYGRGTLRQEAGVRKLCSNLYAKANNLHSRLTGVMYGECFLSTNRLFGYIRRTQPDVVHLQCINGYFVNIYRLIRWLKKQGIPTVLTLHAEFMYTANCAHALNCEGWLHGCGNCPRFRRETNSFFFDRTAYSFRKMRRAFAGFTDQLTVVSVSDWLMERASRSVILAGKRHRVIYNGVDTDIFTRPPEPELKRELGLPGGRLVFHATAMFSDDPDHLKGGCYIIELAKRLQSEGVTVAVAGKYHVNSRMPDNLILLGEIHDQRTLARYYSAADVVVISSQRETFSMICAESLCCGTPVVGFMAGAPEQIALKAYSEFVSFGDMDALEACVRDWMERDLPAGKIAEQARGVYSREAMLEAYKRVYRELTECEIEPIQ